MLQFKGSLAKARKQRVPLECPACGHRSGYGRGRRGARDLLNHICVHHGHLMRCAHADRFHCACGWENATEGMALHLLSVDLETHFAEARLKP